MNGTRGKNVPYKTATPSMTLVNLGSNTSSSAKPTSRAQTRQTSKFASGAFSESQKETVETIVDNGKEKIVTIRTYWTDAWTRVRSKAGSEVDKARESYIQESAFGKGASIADYIRLTVMGLVTSLLLSFFTGMLRGFGPNAIQFGLGIFFLRFLFTVLTYSELRAILDPLVALGAIWVDRVTWRYGIIMFFVYAVGSAAGYGMVHAFNPNGAVIISDGAPLIGTPYVGFIGLSMAWEFLATMLVYSAIFWGYGLKKIHRFYNNWRQMELKGWISKHDEEYSNGERSEEWLMAKDNLRMYIMSKKTTGAAGNLGAALAVGSSAGLVSLIGFGITGSAIDVFAFIWPATYSGLLTAGYPNWWVYLVGPIIGLIGACFVYSIALRLTIWSQETENMRFQHEVATQIDPVVPSMVIIDEKKDV